MDLADPQQLSSFLAGYNIDEPIPSTTETIDTAEAIDMITALTASDNTGSHISAPGGSSNRHNDKEQTSGTKPDCEITSAKIRTKSKSPETLEPAHSGQHSVQHAGTDAAVTTSSLPSSQHSPNTTGVITSNSKTMDEQKPLKTITYTLARPSNVNSFNKNPVAQIKGENIQTQVLQEGTNHLIINGTMKGSTVTVVSTVMGAPPPTLEVINKTIDSGTGPMSMDDSKVSLFPEFFFFYVVYMPF